MATACTWDNFNFVTGFIGQGTKMKYEKLTSPEQLQVGFLYKRKYAAGGFDIYGEAQYLGELAHSVEEVEENLLEGKYSSAFARGTDGWIFWYENGESHYTRKNIEFEEVITAKTDESQDPQIGKWYKRCYNTNGATFDSAEYMGITARTYAEAKQEQFKSRFYKADGGCGWGWFFWDSTGRFSTGSNPIFTEISAPMPSEPQLEVGKWYKHSFNGVLCYCDPGEYLGKFDLSSDDGCMDELCNRYKNAFCRGRSVHLHKSTCKPERYRSGQILSATAYVYLYSDLNFSL